MWSMRAATSDSRSVWEAPSDSSTLSLPLRLSPSRREVRKWDDAVPLAMIPLHDMWQEAIRSGVPFPTKIPAARARDFRTDRGSASAFKTLRRAFAGYLARVGPRSVTLEAQIQANMSLYFRWRVAAALVGTRKARIPGLRTVATTLATYGPQWTRDKATFDQSLAVAQDKLADLEASKAPAKALRDQQHVVRQLRALQATQPKPASQVVADQAVYDSEFLSNCMTLQKLVRSYPQRQLRPHYQAVYDAWVEIHSRGYKPDRALLEFFDRWVHDSLVGFAADATLPTDPRMVFVGHDDRAEGARQKSK